MPLINVKKPSEVGKDIDTKYQEFQAAFASFLKDFNGSVPFTAAIRVGDFASAKNIFLGAMEAFRENALAKVDISKVREKIVDRLNFFAKGAERIEEQEVMLPLLETEIEPGTESSKDGPQKRVTPRTEEEKMAVIGRVRGQALHKYIDNAYLSESGLGTFKPAPIAQHPELLLNDPKRLERDLSYRQELMRDTPRKIDLQHLSFDILKRLVILSNTLDTKGLTQEADIVDKIVSGVIKG